MGPLDKYSLIIKCLIDQAKRSNTQNKSGFAALVNCVVASAAPWSQVYHLEDFNCTVPYCHSVFCLGNTL